MTYHAAHKTRSRSFAVCCCTKTHTHHRLLLVVDKQQHTRRTMSSLLAVASKRVAVASARRTLATSSGDLVQTACFDLHKELGGDMVPFAGYELPVLYKGGEHGGVMKEHLWCRSNAALFDVSHMGQVSCCCFFCVDCRVMRPCV